MEAIHFLCLALAIAFALIILLVGIINQKFFSSPAHPGVDTAPKIKHRPPSPYTHERKNTLFWQVATVLLLVMVGCTFYKNACPGKHTCTACPLANLFPSAHSGWDD